MYQNITKTKNALLFVMFLLTFSLVAHSANKRDSKDTQIQLNLKNVSILQIFKQIEAQTDFTFVYGNEIKSINKQININVKADNIDEVLRQLSREFNLDFQQVNRTISVKIKPSKEQQNRVITGTITDEQGIPIPGASVMAKGTTTGVATDFDGKFSLDLPAGATYLVVSSVGFVTQEIAIAGKKDFKITLK